MGGSVDASTWGALWAMIAVAAAFGVAAAATTLFRRPCGDDPTELLGGYNALAPVLDR